MNPNKLNMLRLFMVGSLLVLILPTASWARMNKKEAQRFEQTVSRLEQAETRIKSNTQRQQQMFQRLESLDSENRGLRGEIEQLNYQIEQMKKRQRELFLDMEQRLQALESKTGIVVGASSVRSTESKTMSNGKSRVFIPDSDTRSEPKDEQSHYRRAFDMLKSGQHSSAITGFRTFVERYPESSLTPNAQYWLGESYYGAGKFEKAVREFEKVRTVYPNTAKVGDASLKLAYSYYELKQWDSARSVLTEITRDFSGSTVAKLAGERLKRMKREGH
jgi:tol-pal system protein YbgF